MGQNSSDGDLPAREAELAERERQAARGPARPEVFAQLAKERNRLADDRDDAADARDQAALLRRQRAADGDVEASVRDRRSREAQDDADPGFPDRFLSGRDVDASAGDRADALADERHARQDGQRAREDRQRAREGWQRAREERQHAAQDRVRAVEAAATAEHRR